MGKVEILTILEVCLYIASVSFFVLGMAIIIANLVELKKIFRKRVDWSSFVNLEPIGYNDELQAEMFKKSLTNDVLQALNALEGELL